MCVHVRTYVHECVIWGMCVSTLLKTLWTKRHAETQHKTEHNARTLQSAFSNLQAELQTDYRALVHMATQPGFPSELLETRIASKLGSQVGGAEDAATTNDGCAPEDSEFVGGSEGEVGCEGGDAGEWRPSASGVEGEGQQAGGRTLSPAPLQPDALMSVVKRKGPSTSGAGKKDVKKGGFGGGRDVAGAKTKAEAAAVAPAIATQKKGQGEEMRGRRVVGGGGAAGRGTSKARAGAEEAEAEAEADMKTASEQVGLGACVSLIV